MIAQASQRGQVDHTLPVTQLNVHSPLHAGQSRHVDHAALAGLNDHGPVATVRAQERRQHGQFDAAARAGSCDLSVLGTIVAKQRRQAQHAARRCRQVRTARDRLEQRYNERGPVVDAQVHVAADTDQRGQVDRTLRVTQSHIDVARNAGHRRQVNNTARVCFDVQVAPT